MLTLFFQMIRTWKSYLVHVLIGQRSFIDILPPHTHDYRLFVTPDEMRDLLQSEGIHLVHTNGLCPVIKPFRTLIHGEYKNVENS